MSTAEIIFGQMSHKKTGSFSKIMIRPHKKGVKAVHAEILQTNCGGNYFTILFGHLLWTSTN